MGKKVFDFRQHTMLMGVPRKTPIISQASYVDERSDHKEDNKPKEQVLIKRIPYQGQIIDLGGEPVDDYRSDAERNKDYWSPIGGAWERNKSQWNNGQHLLQGLGKTMGVAAAIASTANPEALGVANFVQKAHNNPYVQAGMSSLGLADAAYRVKTGNIGKNFDEDVFTALEFVPYLNMAVKSGDNVMKGVRDLKHLPQQIKRKWNASNRIHEQKIQNNKNSFAADDRYNAKIQDLQQQFDKYAYDIAQQRSEINREQYNKRELLRRALLKRDALGVPQLRFSSLLNGRPIKSSLIDFSKISQDNWKKLFAKYPDLEKRVEFIEGKPYFNDGQGSFYSTVNTTSKNIPLFGTDQYVTASILTPTGEKIPMSSYSSINKKNDPIIPARGNIEVNSDYIKALQHNIDYVLNEFPGSVPFGSSVGVAKANFPHITDDIDLFIPESRLTNIEQKYGPRTNWQQKVGDKDGTGVQTYKLQLENGKYGDAGDIDLNVLYADPNTGNAVGQRSLELFRQLFPDDYQEALLQAERTKTPIVITKTPEELINNINPSKTILDSFESNKDKHIPRSLIYLQDADPDQVYEGLKKYYESFLGSKVRHAPVHESQFTDYANNRRLLDQMGIAGLDDDKIASDPKRMRNLFQYWWMENTSYGRGVSAEGDFFSNSKKYMTEMGGHGGQAAGPGLNTVLFGDSGHKADIYGMVQPEISGIAEGMSPQDILNAVRRSQGYNLSLSDEQISQINNILNKYNIAPITKTPEYKPLINIMSQLGYNKEGVYGVANIMGINGLLGNSYGNSTYYGGMRPFNRPNDLLSFINTSYNNGSRVYPIPHNERIRHIPTIFGQRIPEGLSKITSPNKHFDSWYKDVENLLYKPKSLKTLADNRVVRQANKKLLALDNKLENRHQQLREDKAIERSKNDAVHDTRQKRTAKLNAMQQGIQDLKPLLFGIGGGSAATLGIYGLLQHLTIPDKEIWKIVNPQYKDFIDSLSTEEINYIKKHHIRNSNQQKSILQLIKELKDQKFDEKRKNKQ